MVSKRARPILASTWALETEDDARYLFSQAENCVNGECPIDDARDLLGKVLLVRGECDSDSRLSFDSVCEEQDVAAELVANLRVKAAGGDGSSALELQNEQES